MTETTFDWAAYVAAPRYFCGDSWERWSPWSYRRPDGTVATCVGCSKIILRIDGGHCTEVVDYEQRPHSEVGRKPTGRTIDNLFDQPLTPIGTSTVAVIRSLVGEPVAEPPGVEKGCPECNGSGVVKCYACGHKHNCKECDGSGKKELPDDDPDPTFTEIGGQTFDNRLLAAILAGLPDGSVSLAVGRKAADASILCVSGDGWKVMAMPFLRTDEEKSNPVNVLPLTKPDHAADQA